MKTKLILLLVLTSLGFAIAMMVFTPSGSTNPNESGFYVALGSGFIWLMLMYFVLRKNFR